MNKTIWKQTDSRWAALPYPIARRSTVGGCGCGLLACTHIAMEQERYKNWTPKNLRPWMVSKGFAEVGNGTKWEGITQTLKHIGHKEVVRVYNDPMTVAWKELNKGKRIGIILFCKHNSRGRLIPSYGPDGTLWTGGGHYIAFTDYKLKDGKHYFYMKDSGGRNHSGWYSYEKSMRGCISKMWIVERVGKQTAGEAVTVKSTSYKPTKPYTGSLPAKTVKAGTTGSDAKAVQSFLNWCIGTKLTVDGIVGSKTLNYIMVFQKTYGLTVDGIFGSASIAMAKAIVDSKKPKSPSPKVAKATTKTNAQKINDKALELAWPVGTPEKKYRKKGGAPTKAFKKAWKKRFPKSKINTGCHSAVRLVLRETIDPKAMPSLDWPKILKYFRTSGKYQEIKVNYKQSQLKAGDIRIHYTDHSHHIWIICNNGQWLRFEANQGSSNDRYAHLTRSTAGNQKKHKKDFLFRAK